jgi:hypothetical protein
MKLNPIRVRRSLTLPCLLFLCVLCASAGAAGISTNEMLVTDTNKVLHGPFTNFFLNNSNLLNAAIGPLPMADLPAGALTNGYNNPLFTNGITITNVAPGLGGTVNILNANSKTNDQDMFWFNYGGFEEWTWQQGPTLYQIGAPNGLLTLDTNADLTVTGNITSASNITAGLAMTATHFLGGTNGNYTTNLTSATSVRHPPGSDASDVACRVEFYISGFSAWPPFSLPDGSNVRVFFTNWYLHPFPFGSKPIVIISPENAGWIDDWNADNTDSPQGMPQLFALVYLSTTNYAVICCSGDGVNVPAVHDAGGPTNWIFGLTVIGSQ